MTKVIKFQVTVTFLYLCLFNLIDAINHLFMISLLVGSGWVLLNWMILFWSWRQIFKKKLIALSIGIIVIKYAILGIILFYIVSSNRLDIRGFLIGLSTILPTVIGYAWAMGKNQGPSLNESGL